MGLGSTQPPPLGALSMLLLPCCMPLLPPCMLLLPPCMLLRHAGSSPFEPCCWDRSCLVPLLLMFLVISRSSINDPDTLELSSILGFLDSVFRVMIVVVAVVLVVAVLPQLAGPLAAGT